MRVVFMGTPVLAAAALAGLHEAGYALPLVVTQPDKPQGRGRGVVFCPVKQFGLTHGIPVLQPQKISDEVQILDNSKPDVIVTCAYGQILRQNVLDYCRHGVINVHASLLPKYRGSSPIQWSIINGEKQTGITIMQTDAGMDTGDIILQMPAKIDEGETAGELFVRLSVLGAEALVKVLEQIESGVAKRVPQNNLEATVFPMLSKEDGRIHWTQHAIVIANLIHGLNPWPVAYFLSGGCTVRVHRAMPFSLEEMEKKYPFIKVNTDSDPQALRSILVPIVSTPLGTVLHASSAHGMFVLCQSSVLRLDEIQIPGGRKIPTREFLNGRTFAEGTVLE